MICLGSHAVLSRRLMREASARSAPRALPYVRSRGSIARSHPMPSRTHDRRVSSGRAAGWPCSRLVESAESRRCWMLLPITRPSHERHAGTRPVRLPNLHSCTGSLDHTPELALTRSHGNRACPTQPQTPRSPHATSRALRCSLFILELHCAGGTAGCLPPPASTGARRCARHPHWRLGRRGRYGTVVVQGRAQCAWCASGRARHTETADAIGISRPAIGEAGELPPVCGGGVCEPCQGQRQVRPPSDADGTVLNGAAPWRSNPQQRGLGRRAEPLWTCPVCVDGH